MSIDKSQLPAEVLAHVNELESKITNLVSEIQEERSKKQDNEAKVTRLSADLDKLKQDLAKAAPQGQPSVEDAVNKVLSARDQTTAAENRKTAEAKFKTANKEFHDENDQGGIKFGALIAKSKRLNAEGLKTEEDFIGLLSEAKVLLMNSQNNGGQNFNPSAHSPAGSSFTPKITDPNELDPKELKLIDHLGWTKETYLKHKTKRPSYVRSLLADYNG
jgi:uncharacterized phage infection (PIP) family protein YhgE